MSYTIGSAFSMIMLLLYYRRISKFCSYHQTKNSFFFLLCNATQTFNQSRTADCYKHVHSVIIKNPLFLCKHFNDDVVCGMYLRKITVGSPYFTAFPCHFNFVNILTSLQLLLEVVCGWYGSMECLHFPLSFVKCGYRWYKLKFWVFRNVILCHWPSR